MEGWMDEEMREWMDEDQLGGVLGPSQIAHLRSRVNTL